MQTGQGQGGKVLIYSSGTLVPMAFWQLLEAQVKVISHFSSFPALVPGLNLTTITYVTVTRPDHRYILAPPPKFYQQLTNA